MPIKELVKSFMLFHSTIVLTKSNFKSKISLSTILHFSISLISFQYIYYIKLENFQSKSVLLITENCLPLTDKVTVEVLHKCLQHLHLLALQFEMLGYIPPLLNGLIYLRKMGDSRGDNLTLRLLQKH